MEQIVGMEALDGETGSTEPLEASLVGSTIREGAVEKRATDLDDEPPTPIDEVDASDPPGLVSDLDLTLEPSQTDGSADLLEAGLRTGTGRRVIGGSLRHQLSEQRRAGAAPAADVGDRLPHRLVTDEAATPRGVEQPFETLRVNGGERRQIDDRSARRRDRQAVEFDDVPSDEAPGLMEVCEVGVAMGGTTAAGGHVRAIGGKPWKSPARGGGGV